MAATGKGRREAAQLIKEAASVQRGKAVDLSHTFIPISHHRRRKYCSLVHFVQCIELVPERLALLCAQSICCQLGDRGDSPEAGWHDR